MNGSLNVTAEELKGIGNSVNNLAEETKSLMNRVQNEIQALDSVWAGTTERDYAEKALGNVDAINKLLEQYADAGSSLVRTAGNYENTSQEIMGAIKF